MAKFIMQLIFKLIKLWGLKDHSGRKKKPEVLDTWKLKEHGNITRSEHHLLFFPMSVEGVTWA